MRYKTVVLALAAAVFSPVVFASPRAPNLAETIERWEHLRVDPQVKVSDLRLTSRNLTVTLRSGTASVVRAGDEPVGFFLSGAGSLEYRSVDPIEFPLLVHNLRTATGLSPDRKEKAVTIRDAFTEALWLQAGQPPPEISGARGGSDEPVFRRHVDRLGHVRMSPFPHLFAIQKLDAPTRALVLAEFSGGKTDLAYLLDDVLDASEGLYVLRKSTSTDPAVRDRIYPIVLSQQPVDRDRRVPPVPAFALTDVRIDVRASDSNEAAITAIETIVPQKRPQSVFRFDFFNTRFTVVGSGALEPRTFRLRSVTDESGEPLAFHHAGEELVVGLPRAAEPDRPVRLKFEIEGDFLIRPGGDNFWILGVEPWFPQPEFGGQYYTWHATVRVKKPFVPFSSGTTISRRSEGEFNVLETATDKPVQFAVVLAGKYEFQEESRNGVKIRVATYAFRNARAMKQLTSLAASIIEYYEAFLGPFPFPEFQILEINQLGFGQAPPGVMFITKEAFSPFQGEEAQLFSQGVNERFAHEIAHQYWAHVVKMPGPEEQWLTESFAEYSAALFLKQFKGKGVYDTLVAHWKSRAGYARDAAPIPLANQIYDPLTGFILRNDLLYDKGPYLLAAIHKQVGDDTFLTFLKSYQKSFRWKFGSTRTVEGLLQFLTKKDYGPFFESYYWGTEMPN